MRLLFDYYRGADIERMEMYSKIYSKCSQASWQTVAVMKKEGYSSRRLVRTLNARYRNVYTWDWQMKKTVLQ